MARPKKRHYEYVEKLGRYRARIKDADGKRVAIYGRTEAELEEKLSIAQDQIEELRQYASDQTVRDYATRWLKRQTTGMALKNAEIYNSVINNYVIPNLGEKKLRAVLPSDCEEIMQSIAHKSKSLCGKVLNVMRKMFEAAVDDGLIAKNPAKKLKAAGVKSPPKYALTPDQQARLLDTVKGLSIDTFVRLALFCGLRREEALALKWDAVHLSEPAYLEVRRALRWEHNRAVVSETLKTEAARRTVPIPSELAGHLREIPEKAGFVCSGAEPMTGAAFRRAWDKITARTAGERSYVDKKTGKTVTRKLKLGDKIRNRQIWITLDFSVTPHILRHTYASNLIAGGVDPKTVQYLLGHTDAGLTLEIYTHLIDHSPAALAKAVNPEKKG